MPHTACTFEGSSSSSLATTQPASRITPGRLMYLTRPLSCTFRAMIIFITCLAERIGQSSPRGRYPVSPQTVTGAGGRAGIMVIANFWAPLMHKTRNLSSLLACYASHAGAILERAQLQGQGGRCVCCPFHGHRKFPFGFVRLGVEPRVLGMLDKHSTAELQLQAPPIFKGSPLS